MLRLCKQSESVAAADDGLSSVVGTPSQTSAMNYTDPPRDGAESRPGRSTGHGSPCGREN
jgi:hypothetical protein